MEEEMTTRPTWLLELENRKRKPRLAHEAGAGAPCTNCKSACPGLDLHFWRKICKNCKCGRDDHDVDDAEFPQFDLLFGLSIGKFKNKSMRLQINNKKQNDDETTFEWVPPNTTKDLAVDYMKALPAEKLPIKGSVGAVLRRQLLQKQLPLHDIDHKICDELSEQEQKQFEKYLENIKRYVGQGKVMKMFGARPFDRSLMTPVNATDMHKCSPQHKSHIPIFHSASVQLRTPSSFAARGPYARPPYDGQNKRDATTAAAPNNEVQSGTKEYNCTIDTVLASSTIARSQPIEGNVICDTFHVPRENDKGKNGTMVTSSILTHLAEQEMVAARERHTLGNYSPYGEDGETLNADTTLLPWGIAPLEAVDDKTTLAESMLADALLPPSAIHANDIVGSTLDEKGLTYIREKLAEKYNVAENPVARRAVFKSFRPSDASNVSSPSPSPSLSPSPSPPLQSVESKDNDNPAGRTKYAEVTQYAAAARNPVEMAQTGVPLEARNEEKNVLKPQSQVVESTVVPAITDINEEKRCDLLSTTNDPLMTLTTSKAVMESTVSPLSSKRHHSPDSQKQKPVAARPCPLQVKLSSLVLQPSVIHSEQLQNQVFPHVVGGQGSPEQYTQLTDCLKGTIDTFKLDSTKVAHECEKCQKCHEDIRVGDVVVTAEKATNAAWHPGCFVCSICNELLVDLVYFYYKNQLYCGRDLATFLGIPRCFACDELIFVREYTVAEGHNYHVKHFCCWDCDMPLAGQQYITENDRPLCLPCYQKSYAKTCAACNIVIAADQQGVAIKNLNFHATQVCFCCYSCKKNLLNGRMAIKKDKLFCSKECIARFFN